LLAAIGTYGVSLNFVSQRRRELGVRLALGAEPGHLRSLVLRQGLFLAIIGVVVGLVLAVLAGGALASVLYGIHGADPIVLAMVPILLLLVAAISTFIPAEKATRVSPVEVLRAE
jgi:ABC-type antimicrobial peptide transport system permease subunit